MSRPAHYIPLEVKKAYREVREYDSVRHRDLVQELKAAHEAIENGRCPSCGAQMFDSACSGCRFRIVVAPPVVVDCRSTFNRRPTKKGYGSGPVSR
jgi:hypothetical protein